MDRIKRYTLLVLENSFAIATVVGSAIALLTTTYGAISDRDLLIWLLALVALLSTSELVQRFLQLSRIEKQVGEWLNFQQLANTPISSVVYAHRIEAGPEIAEAMKLESLGISIVAGTLHGTFRILPDLLESIRKASSSGRPKFRILICDPDYMAVRSRLEGLSPNTERRVTLQNLTELVEATPDSENLIRLYRAVPTCTAIVCEGERVLLVNPYTMGNMAERTLTMVINGRVAKSAYDTFVDSHIEKPWADNDISISLGNFVELENDRVVSEIADRITKLSRPGNKPTLIAINGKAATGKSLLARRLCDRAMSGQSGRSLSCAYLSTDSWLRQGRAEREAQGLTGLEAAAYDLDALEAAIRKLLNRESVMTPIYDHSHGVHDGSRNVDASDLIIVEGLMSTHPRLRQFFDRVYWIDCSEQNHKRFRIERDVLERGYTRAGAEANYERHFRHWESWAAEMKPSQATTLRINRVRLLTVD
jgi:uridine kinase